MGLLQDKLNQSGGQKQQPSPENTGFMHRLALSFGGKAADEERARIEQQTGTAGKFDVGDIADVAGKTLPFIGATLMGIGGSVIPGAGTAAGIAAGAGAGEAVRRSIGSLLPIQKESLSRNVYEVGKETALTYAGGKILGSLFNVATKVIPNKFMATIFKQSADDIQQK